jgi:hypothetical protein
MKTLHDSELSRLRLRNMARSLAAAKTPDEENVAIQDLERAAVEFARWISEGILPPFGR